jgi:hypothetical protein
MRKNEVYSWRLSYDTKAALEFEASREGSTLAALLDRIADEWLRARRPAATDETEQARLHAAAARSFGAIAGGDPRRAERARLTVRTRLARRHGRQRTD